MHTGKQRPYELQEYNPEWKQWFKEKSDRIKPLFGDNLVSIDHIGSTSIEGMYAKPNIDILAVVKNLDAVDLRAFTAAGYTSQGRGYVSNDDEYITEDTTDGKRVTSIHTLEVGNPKIREYREFREYLNNNQQDRNVYIALKKALYAEHPKNYGAYDSGKTDTINQIKKRAHVWAEHNLPQEDLYNN
jgi:GrpB-like predicted nucleotidyltransferase (UPF0157 family)